MPPMVRSPVVLTHRTALTPFQKYEMKYLLLLALLFSETHCLHAAESRPPNILFIIADDQSPFDLKVYDSDSALETPTIDRLAAEGMVIDGAYHMGSWSGAVCTPSRTMVMTGRTLWHLPGGNPRANDRKYVPADIAAQTMPAVFNTAGYDTMRTCKQGNSYPAANRLFSVVHDAIKRGATDDTGSAWHAERVLDYLTERESAADADPFLIYLGFSHPHDTRDGTPALLAKYGAVNHEDSSSLPLSNAKQPALPANYLPKHPFDNSHMDVRDEVAVSGVWTNRDETTIRNELGREFACSENIDVQIHRVLKKLEEMGELENTYVFYCADHGMAIGRHGLQGKQNLYEHTWRIPLVVKGPGIQSGTRALGNVYLLDVLATMCDLVGIEPPRTCEGKSFAEVLRGERATIRDAVYGCYCGGQKPGMRCVRRGDWKLIRYETADGSAETQLFNLRDNPHELLLEHHNPEVVSLTGCAPTPEQRNIASDPAFAGKLEELNQLLIEKMRELDDPYRFADQNQ